MGVLLMSLKFVLLMLPSYLLALSVQNVTNKTSVGRKSNLTLLSRRLTLREKLSKRLEKKFFGMSKDFLLDEAKAQVLGLLQYAWEEVSDGVDSPSSSMCIATDVEFQRLRVHWSNFIDQGQEKLDEYVYEVKDLASKAQEFENTMKSMTGQFSTLATLTKLLKIAFKVPMPAFSTTFGAIQVALDNLNNNVAKPMYNSIKDFNKDITVPAENAADDILQKNEEAAEHILVAKQVFNHHVYHPGLVVDKFCPVVTESTVCKTDVKDHLHTVNDELDKLWQELLTLRGFWQQLHTFLTDLNVILQSDLWITFSGFFTDLEVLLQPFDDFLTWAFSHAVCQGYGTPYIKDVGDSSGNTHTVQTTCYSKKDHCNQHSSSFWDNGNQKCYWTKAPSSWSWEACPSGWGNCVSSCTCQKPCFKSRWSMWCNAGESRCGTHCQSFTDTVTVTGSHTCEQDGWSSCSNNNWNCDCYNPAAEGCLFGSFAQESDTGDAQCCEFSNPLDNSDGSTPCFGSYESGEWCMTVKQFLNLPDCLAQAVIDAMWELISPYVPDMPGSLEAFTIPGVTWPTIPDMTLPSMALPEFTFSSWGFSCLATAPGVDSNGLPVVDPLLPLCFELPSLNLGDLQCPSPAGQFLEVAQISISGTSWSSFSFKSNFAEPPVVLLLPSAEGGDPATIRVKSITSSGFSAVVAEPEGRDGIHADMTVAYAAISPGVHSLPDGRVIEVGHVQTTTTQATSKSSCRPQGLASSWQEVVFQHAFNQEPVFVTTLQTSANEVRNVPQEPSAPWLVVATSGISTSSASVALEMAQAGRQTHSVAAPETIGYVAMERGSGSFSDSAGQLVRYDALLSGRVVKGWDDGARVINFAGDLQTSAPLVIGSQSSRNGADGGWLRLQSVSATGANLLIDEDTACDSERWHTTEQVSLIAWSRTFEIGV
mmetsp:Transcript_5577/g.9269  ORF Transcript_5577/g.9269 Transcript_5577/m.9269 type:complete len:932 (+) Transcript_5577:64-2859(+)